jgi:hypothetical protein
MAALTAAAPRRPAQCATAPAGSAVDQSQLSAAKQEAGWCRGPATRSRQVRKLHDHTVCVVVVAREACSGWCTAQASTLYVHGAWMLCRTHKQESPGLLIDSGNSCMHHPLIAVYCMLLVGAPTLPGLSLLCAVCTATPEAPTGGSFNCGSSMVAGTVCNGTCSTGGGPITATCQSTGNWTVQGTCAAPLAGGDGLCVVAHRHDTANDHMLLGRGLRLVGPAACATGLLGRCMLEIVLHVCTTLTQ